MISGVIPPVLRRQKRLAPDVEGRFLPTGMVEAVIIGLWRKGGRDIGAGVNRLFQQLRRVLLGALNQLELAARRPGEVNRDRRYTHLPHLRLYEKLDA